MRLWRKVKPTARAKLSARSFDLLSLSAAFVLAVHAAHLPAWLSFALFVALGLRWWQRRRQPGSVPGWLKVPLLVIWVGAVVLQYGTLFGREPGSALGVGLLVLKLAESEAPRDARVGAAFACFLLMAALLFGQSMVMTLVVALGLLPALGLLLTSLPLTLIAFVLVPRLSTPLWGTQSPSSGKTGLSDHMSPGQFMELLLDDSAALRVDFNGPPPPLEQRYFRAFVMWHYDGRDWKRIAQPISPQVPVEAVQTIDYRMSLEPTHQHVLPTLDVPLGPPPPAQSKARVTRQMI